MSSVLVAQVPGPRRSPLVQLADGAALVEVLTAKGGPVDDAEQPTDHRSGRVGS
jgi:hypothetical protein